MIPTKTRHLETAALTHPGMTGKNNEDRYTIMSYRKSESDPTPVLFALIADGIGGKQAGELAAQIAVDAITEAVTASDGDDPAATLRQALLDSSTAILERAAEQMDAQGMGTTATGAWIAGDRLHVVNAGNSRLYLMRDDVLRRITIDHSWVQAAIDHNILTPEQARDHPNARIITRYLGAESMEPDLRIQLAPDEDDDAMLANQGVPLRPDDILLLCSDGLSDVVEDAEIAAALRRSPLQAALQGLTDLANARGGPDNITSIALQVPRPRPGAVKKGLGRQRPAAARLGVYLLSILVLVSLILIGWGFVTGLIP